MNIILMIIQILGAIPTIIKIISQIIELIDQLNPDDKKDMKVRLRQAVLKAKRAKQTSEDSTLVKDLESILSDLQQKAGAKHP